MPTRPGWNDLLRPVHYQLLCCPHCGEPCCMVPPPRESGDWLLVQCGKCRKRLQYRLWDLGYEHWEVEKADGDRIQVQIHTAIR